MDLSADLAYADLLIRHARLACRRAARAREQARLNVQHAMAVRAALAKDRELRRRGRCDPP